MKISDACNHKKSLSFEIFPPKKDSELKNIDATLDVLCELQPDFISVTFGAGGSLNCNRTIELAKKIKQNYHVEPVVHLTCLHYNRAEIDEFARQCGCSWHHAGHQCPQSLDFFQGYLKGFIFFVKIIDFCFFARRI